MGGQERKRDKTMCAKRTNDRRSLERMNVRCFNGAYTEKTEKENGEVAANGVSDFYHEPRAAARLLSPFDLTLAVSSFSLSLPSGRLSFSLFFPPFPPLIGDFPLCKTVPKVQREVLHILRTP